MKGYTYVLLSEKDNRTYTGSTDNLERRLKEHQDGICKSTANRRPLRLIYFEEFDSLNEARYKERYFKTASGRRKLREILSL